MEPYFIGGRKCVEDAAPWRGTASSAGMRMLYSFRPDPHVVSRALGLLCTTPCRELEAFSGALRLSELSKTIVRDRETLTTWLPRWRVPCVFRVLADGKTAVCLAGDIFYASDALSLLPGAPSDAVFFGHYTEDSVKGAMVPRVLVYDVGNMDESLAPASQRYAQLRGLATFLPAPVCVVQWAGHLRAAEKVLARRDDYPHDIEDLLCLTEDVYQNEIPMRVDTNQVGVTIVPRQGMQGAFLACDV